MKQIAQHCIEKIRTLKFKNLPISEYNRSYIKRLKPNLEYYFSIYSQVLSLLPEHQPQDRLIVDFGGGHGFFSIFLKALGYKVIYCDLNSESVKTIRCIKEKISLGPDFIIEGSASELKQFCQTRRLKLDFLVATDLIEHVYDLDVFFKDLYELNPSLEMVFTTGSNPHNSRKCKKLRKYMKKAEKEYFPLRRDFIKERFLEFKSEEVDLLARLCRGKTYPDIQKTVMLYIKTGTLPEELSDRFNTCDPSNGNWTERILSFDEYSGLASKNGFSATFFPGFYNEYRRNKLFAAICRRLNLRIKNPLKNGWELAPYILIKLSPSNE